MFNLLTSNKKIYLDYASITPTHMKVVAHLYDIEKKNTYGEFFATNASSLHEGGTNAKKILEDGRRDVASYIGAHSDEVYFTASGTEANNIAITGVINHFIEKNPTVKPHIILSEIEHSSIREVVMSMEKDKKVDVTYIKVSQSGAIGVIDPLDIKKVIRPETVLVSVMSANNEIGTIQPIKEIGKIVHRHNETLAEGHPRVFFHVDACQSLIYGDIDMTKLSIDLMTIDSQKVYGPRGIGALYIRRGVEKMIKSPIIGGGQEKGVRGGTENIAGVSGFALALNILKKEKDKFVSHVSKCRTAFLGELKRGQIDFVVNGDDATTVPHILNISFSPAEKDVKKIDAEYLLFLLNSKGVMCSTKSACLRDDDESYVLHAIGVPMNSSLRFSFGLFTGIAECKRAGKILVDLIKSGLASKSI